jgi:hypothetical protein
VAQLEERGFTADRAAIEAVVKDYTEELHKMKPGVTKTEPPDGE